MDETDQTNELEQLLRAETESRIVMDVAKHTGERIFEIVKQHACTMPTVSAAIGVGLLAMQEIYRDTITFATKIMDGDTADITEIRAAARELALELIEIADGEIDDAAKAGDLA